MKIINFGLNHKTADISLREKVYIKEQKYKDVLNKILEIPYIFETLVLSTCNRTEIYFSCENFYETESFFNDFIIKYFNLKKDDRKFFYKYEEREAIKHLYEVVSSVDSMVVGENQIINQVKKAYNIAREYKCVYSLLEYLFTTGFLVGKKVRTKTDIVKYPVSVGSIAVELSKNIFSDLKEKTGLLIGRGEMSEIVANHLIENEIKEILVVNRNKERAKEFAEKINACAYGFEDIDECLLNCDIVITATSAPQPVLRYDRIKNIMTCRNHQPLFIVDIAIPRDVEKEVEKIENVFLYNIDDLKNISDENFKFRQKEINKINEIIAESVELFYQKRELFKIGSIMKEIKEKYERVVNQEIEKFNIRFSTEKDRQMFIKRVCGKTSYPLMSLVKEISDKYGVDYVKEKLPEILKLRGEGS